MLRAWIIATLTTWSLGGCVDQEETGRQRSDNRPPTIAVTSLVTDEDVPLSGVLDVVDPEGEPFEVTLASRPGLGTLSLEPDGRFRYAPAHDLHGLDTFEVVVSDPHGPSAPIGLTVEVRPLNDAPRVKPVNYGLVEDGWLDARIDAFDPEGDVVHLLVEVGPEHGHFEIHPPFDFVYVPDRHFVGSDSFEVVATDGLVESPPTRMVIAVNNRNDPPSGGGFTSVYAVDEDTVLHAPLPFTDPDGELDIVLLTSPDRGTVTFDPTGEWFTYEPDPDRIGTDTFAVFGDDGSNQTLTQQILVTILPVNDPPQVVPLSLTTAIDQPVSGVVTASDVEGDPLDFAVAREPLHGIVTLDPTSGQLTYTPESQWTGTDEIHVAVSDGAATVTIVVPIRVEPP